ncbi:MAG: lytic transglycosylase domain-containing protein [Limnohabitans sp.]|nr:lytic transglycosylase domain-containing protein [Limnohabitans sp.]
MSIYRRFIRSISTVFQDIASGFFLITHSGLAFVGLIVFFLAVTLTIKPELRANGEAYLLGWLQENQTDESVTSDYDAVDRATATDPKDLPKQQANVAYWLSRKYRVAPEPLSALVAEAYDIGPRSQIDPNLILAVMAIESGFNPFAQSQMGAQGLMQVMTKVHSDKYDSFGGKLAAFDPIANLRVGVNVLKECIVRTGSVEAGLKQYVGAANLDTDSGYASKVMAEHKRLIQVAQGQWVPITKPSAIDTVTEKVESWLEKAQRLTNIGGAKEGEPR